MYIGIHLIIFFRFIKTVMEFLFYLDRNFKLKLYSVTYYYSVIITVGIMYLNHDVTRVLI